ncbi:MAG: ATP phosphoribosyltransferase regulatory subunit, partial [Lactococcus lactis]
MEKINYLLPEESAEMTLNQVKSLRQIEGRLRKLFGLKNYQEVMPPSFEYTQLYTALESNGKTFNQEKMFQFINHEGQSITLRYDFTL